MINNTGNLNFGAGSAFTRLTLADIQRNSTVVSSTPAARVGDSFTPSVQVAQEPKKSPFKKIVGTIIVAAAAIWGIKRHMTNKLVKEVFEGPAKAKLVETVNAHKASPEKLIDNLSHLINEKLDKLSDSGSPEIRKYILENDKNNASRMEEIKKFVTAVIKGEEKLNVNGTELETNKLDLTGKGLDDIYVYTLEKLKPKMPEVMKGISAKGDAKKAEITEALFKQGEEGTPSIVDEALSTKLMEKFESSDDTGNVLRKFFSALTGEKS